MAEEFSRFKFAEHVDRDVIEEAIAQAIFAVECIHNPLRVRLGVRYYLSEDREPLCLIATGTVVGEHVARIFTGIVTRRLGEEAFRVTRIDGGHDPLASEEFPRGLRERER